MPTPSDQSSEQLSLADQFASLTGEQVYDSIMSGIEPELVLANLESLDEPYGGESEADRATRYERYGKAFSKYIQAYQAFMKNLGETIHVYKRAVLKAAEYVNGSKESELLQGLTDQIATL